MATFEEAISKMRAMCLALPDATEGSHHGSVGFYVKKKLFATCSEKAITFGLEPDHAEELAKREPRFKPYARDRRALVLALGDVKAWAELEPLLKESWAISLSPRGERAGVRGKSGAKTQQRASRRSLRAQKPAR